MVKLTELTDKYFIDNGYFHKKTEVSLHGAYKYSYYITTDKWKQLFDTAIAMTPKNKIITPETIMQIINNGDMKRTKVKRYKKLSIEEKERRKALKRKLKAEREFKNGNRNSE